MLTPASDIVHSVWSCRSTVNSAKHKSVFAARDGEPVVKGQMQPRIERRLLAKSLKTLVISKGKPAPAWTHIVVKMALKGQLFDCLY